ncbi:threonine aldolase family protein [Hydrogenophaga sp. BPS33]|uniref:threonine aldolase family protein n=1 Tax=Hydrogenophaga sp. BPS33 TaxID=2651974 RepID=UPI00135A9347|nr:beta-eliminating lyase-related protein [Hydrogenophaga sp. BPS33]
MDLIDLRSDFLAPLSQAMRAAAATAADARHFGLREDPWQQRLEARVAELLGKEDALIFPTCSMANTVALMAQCRPGDTVLCPADAHVLLSEGNAAAALAGVALHAVADPGEAAERQWFAPTAAWAQALGTGADAQRAPVTLCVLENTHNRAGGWALPVDHLDAVAQAAASAGVGLHMDGARLLYAAAAQGVAPARLARGCDSIALSLNKHTGAPVAALLVGSRALIERALVLRQRLGGGLRPVGAACAAALQGLSELDELPAVIERTRRLAHALAALPRITVNEPERSTNLVVVEFAPSLGTDHALSELASRNVLALPFGPGRLRLALHRGITDAQVDAVLAAATLISSRL